MIDTIHGRMDESTLKKIEEIIDNENEFTTVTEYWQLVHRSVAIVLKKGTVLSGVAGEIN